MSSCRWSDPEAPTALLQLLLEDLRQGAPEANNSNDNNNSNNNNNNHKGSDLRPVLWPSLWQHVASFLRYPAPMSMVYVLGGRQPKPGIRGAGEEHLATAEVFDWWHCRWVPLPPMSTARVGAAAALLGNLVVVAGGYNGSMFLPLSSVEAFDPATRSWHSLPSLPTRRYGLALTTFDGCLYAMGGDDGVGVTAANEVYNPSTGSWCAVAPLPLHLAGGKADAYGRYIYYAGGCDENDRLSDAVFVYDPALDLWIADNDRSNEPRLKLSAGRTSFAMSLLNNNSNNCNNNSNNNSSSGASSATSRQKLGASLVVIGGVSTSEPSPQTELLLLDEKEFCEKEPHAPAMPQHRSGCRSTVLWPLPRRPYLPWTQDETGGGPDRKVSEETEEGGAACPFVLVLGGETLHPDAPPTEGCSPLVLDMSRLTWESLEELPTKTDRVDFKHFLKAVRGMRTSRIAFAMTVAPGWPAASSELERA
ncbi:unnamed protein product [Polarella glacialis]|uniref:Uncharacterized protein n=1 Tax=Polarella glacialis TaxID=89957 RepID=A0A813F2C1_POLGL|nr:unnamed protein product [Polarella glacialis]